MEKIEFTGVFVDTEELITRADDFLGRLGSMDSRASAMALVAIADSLHGIWRELRRANNQAEQIWNGNHK